MSKDSEEILILRKRFESHVETYRLDSVDYAERQIRQDLAHTQNMEAIDKLTKATQSVVDAWKVANGFQKFIKWLSSFAVLGVAFAWLVSKLPPNFFTLP